MAIVKLTIHMTTQASAMTINLFATTVYTHKRELHLLAYTSRSVDTYLTSLMIFGVPIEVHNDTELYPLMPWTILIFESTPHSPQFLVFNLMPHTMRTFGMSLNDGFEAPARILFVPCSKQYGPLVTERQHLYL